MEWLGTPIQIAGGRKIHLPKNHSLVPIGDDPIVIDLATSQISGLIIHESVENVLSVFGPPDFQPVAGEEFYFAHHGMCATFICRNLHAMHLWTSAEIAKSGLKYFIDGNAITSRMDQAFSPCNASVIGRGESLVILSDGVSRAQVETNLGTPDRLHAGTGGFANLTYFGQVADGDYDRLHLDLQFSDDMLTSIYMTH